VNPVTLKVSPLLFVNVAVPAEYVPPVTNVSVPPLKNGVRASLTCSIVALNDDPAGFCDVSPVMTTCIRSFSVTPEANVLSVKNAIFFYL